VFKEQWYWCKTCNYAFPASEASAHNGNPKKGEPKHDYYPIAT
jgi:hypothetical protein